MATILLVDDDNSIRDVWRRGLEAAGCRVLVAENGWTALAEAERGRPDVLVVDLSTPLVTALRVVEWVLTHLKHTTVIAFTSSGDDGAALLSWPACEWTARSGDLAAFKTANGGKLVLVTPRKDMVEGLRLLGLLEMFDAAEESMDRFPATLLWQTA